MGGGSNNSNDECLTSLRQTLREKRKHLSLHDIKVASNAVFQKIISLPVFSNSQHIACYFANENEIDPSSIVNHAQKQNKKIYFPVLENRELLFCTVNHHTQYEKNALQILEPVHTQNDFFPTEKIDLFLIPLVVFDTHCHRVGRGAGFYDRTLTHRSKNATMIGLAYAFQKVDRIIPQSWDIAMDMIVTEQNIYAHTPKDRSN